MNPSLPSSSSPTRRRGSVVVIVLWAIAVAAIITSSIQLFGQRQATLGREAIERVQARWAARAGIEDTLAVMTEHTERPIADDARAMLMDMYYVHSGATFDAAGNQIATYSIEHEVDGVTVGGPVDEHSKLNMNRQQDRGMILVLEDMTLDIVDALGDWIDEDDEVSSLGVERDYYLSLEAPYLPRNGPLRTLGELELVAGMWPRYFRNEDWNLNARLDPHEDDGARAFPPDEADGVLDGAWSSSITVYSVAGGATGSGEPRIRLENAETEELQERLGIDAAQATALRNFARSGQASLTDLLTQPLPGSSGSAADSGGEDNGEDAEGGEESPEAGDLENPPRSGGRGGSGSSGDEASASDSTSDGFPPLTEKQLRAVLAETVVEDPLDRLPGKMNLNTVPAQLMRDIFDAMGLDEAIVDEILYMRASRTQGIGSIVDLKKIPNVTNEDLNAITRLFDTVSNVFTVTSRGRSAASGQEIEIIAVVDRSTVPVRILEYREQ